MKIDVLRYMGKPFLRGARGPDSFDCAGILQDIYAQRGIFIELPGWGVGESLDDVSRVMDKAKNEWVRLCAPEPWCAVAMRGPSGLVDHVGVVLDDSQRFIHTMEDCGVMVERLDSMRWNQRIEGYYAWQ